MKNQLLLCLLLGLALAACKSPCESLRANDDKIMEQFKELQSKRLPSDDLRYRAKLQTLYIKEQSILKQVRNCEFPDPTEYNYWYGKRLKYPSELERTWLELSKRADLPSKKGEGRFEP
jgi:hypothetical protein